ncbi:MAG: S1C family serine protease [bacterium]|nr:S1C family serine protease [bacterium]
MRVFRVTFLMFTILGAMCLQALAFTPSPTADIVKRVRKSVIRIQGIDIGAEVASGGYGGGSGVVFQLDYDKGVAYALTNHHVSGDAVLSAVRFWDGTEYKAEMIAREPGIDVALLKLTGIPDERNVPESKKTIIAAPLGDSDKVQIGDHAIAMGSPGARDGFNANRDDPYQDYMLQQTVTDGVITGRDTVIGFVMGIWRQNQASLGMQYGTNFPYAFRVTVPINGGNSGGPMFNDSGEVIGLNFYGGSHSLMQNSNHTVPINSAKDFAYQILNTGKFEKPWIGLDVIMPSYIKSPEAYNEFLERRKSKDLEIYGVRPDSSAERSGFRKGDVILSIDGRKINTAHDLRQFVFNQPIGTRLSFEIKRGGSKLKDPITTEVQPKRFYDSEFSI